MLEYDLATGRWKDYLDPDGEMEIDLYRDDGIIHVIVTGASPADDVVWISTYFGGCRYDGRHWRGYYTQDSGLPSDFTNNVKGRSAHEAWFATDKGAGAVTDFTTNTWVTYTRDPQGPGRQSGGHARPRCAGDGRHAGRHAAQLHHHRRHRRQRRLGGHGKGLGWGIGDGYYPGLEGASEDTGARPP